MKQISIILFSVLMMLSFSLTGLAREWNGIVPLVTTRTEVIGKLGQPLIDEKSEYFIFEGQRVEIRWARPDCYGENRMIEAVELAKMRWCIRSPLNQNFQMKSLLRKK